jgi:hypothetical protein
MNITFTLTNTYTFARTYTYTHTYTYTNTNYPLIEVGCVKGLRSIIVKRDLIKFGGFR